MTRQRNGDNEGEKKKMSFVMQGKKLAARIFLPSIFFLSYFFLFQNSFFDFSPKELFFFILHTYKNLRKERGIDVDVSLLAQNTKPSTTTKTKT